MFFFLEKLLPIDVVFKVSINLSSQIQYLKKKKFFFFFLTVLMKNQKQKNKKKRKKKGGGRRRKINYLAGKTKNEEKL